MHNESTWHSGGSRQRENKDARGLLRVPKPVGNHGSHGRGGAIESRDDDKLRGRVRITWGTRIPMISILRCPNSRNECMTQRSVRVPSRSAKCQKSIRGLWMQVDR